MHSYTSLDIQLYSTKMCRTMNENAEQVTILCALIKQKRRHSQLMLWETFTIKVLKIRYAMALPGPVRH